MTINTKILTYEPDRIYSQPICIYVDHNHTNVYLLSVINTIITYMQICINVSKKIMKDMVDLIVGFTQKKKENLIDCVKL